VLYTSSTLKIEDQVIERVRSFKYLGYWLNETWDSDQELRCRIEIARKFFTKYKTILCNQNISIKLRLRFAKCYVWSVLLYGLESWTLKTSHMNKIEAFEMWIYRRIQKISWVDHISNSEVLRRMGTERALLQLAKRRKTAYFGHLMRNNKYELLQLIVQGKIEGKRGVGRKQLSWARNIRNWTNISSIGELIHLASNKEQFSNIVASL